MLKVVETILKSGKKIKTKAEIYDTVSQVVKDCQTRKITDDEFDDIREEVSDRPSWFGVKSYQEALNLLKDGYQIGIEKFRSHITKVAKGEDKRITFSNNVVGHSPIVPLALIGVPESMNNMSIKPIKAKVIDICYDMTLSSGTTNQEILNVGKKVLGAILDLEMQGYRINLYACQSYYKDGDLDMLIIKVKSSNQPLDIRRICFPLMHTAFFRVIGFDWYSKTPNAKYKSGYGCAVGYCLSREDTSEVVNDIIKGNVVYLSAPKIKDEGIDYIKGEIKSGSNKHK